MTFVEYGHGYTTFREAKENRGDEPWYFNLKNSVKDKLASSTHFIESPDLSVINSITDLFARAQQTSESVWEDAMGTSLDEVFSGYQAVSDKGRQFIQGLSDKESLFKELANNRNWQFESLRKEGDGEIWFALVLALSQREQLKMQILQNWLSNASESDEIKWGMSKDELMVYLGLSLELQPNIDEIYVQQMLISDGDTSRRRNPKEFFTKEGAAFLYIYGPDQEDRDTFGQRFPTEISNIQAIFNKYANIIRVGIEDSRLGDKYVGLPRYLEFLGRAMGSESTDPDKLNDLSEKYTSLCVELGRLGCPIIVNPWGFIGEQGERVDMELLVGINLGDKSSWYNDSRAIQTIAENYGKEVGLSDDSIVPIIHQIFLAVNGSNITYTSLASAGKYINFNDARHAEVGIDRYARYKQYIKNGVSLPRFIKSIGIGTIGHEFAHLFFYPEGDVAQKMGTNINSNKYEELKADAIGSLLFKKYLESGACSITSTEYLEQYLLNYLDDILDAPDSTVDKSPTWYSFNGQTIIVVLLESGSIDYVEGQFVIIKAEEGVAKLAELGKAILESYKDPNFTTVDVDAFVTNREAKYLDNHKLQIFLSDLRAQHRQ